MNPIDWVLLLLLGAAVAAALVCAIRKKKKGCCCGDCEACEQNCASLYKTNKEKKP